ncbi:hypothetical protein E2C01_074556 [Portunus trituberculatus]|uniref:Uncharacterized protein n=1 Tax=Portunus trituberculatus TaxID=210409 RepID=A0A5B7ICS5_PORTR|nr:hypothetical protein [Portunus trituberculatus]
MAPGQPRPARTPIVPNVRNGRVWGRCGAVHNFEIEVQNPQMGTARESSGFWSHEAIPTAHLIQLRIQVAYPAAVVRAIVTLLAPVTATRAACHFAAWMGPLYISPDFTSSPNLWLMYARTFRRCSQKSDEFLVTVGRERREGEAERGEERGGDLGPRRCEGRGEGTTAGRGPVGRRHLQYFYFSSRPPLPSLPLPYPPLPSSRPRLNH